MPDEPLALLSTLLSLPDEHALVPLARSAALGDLAADVAHDLANSLFGVLGLVDLLLADATPETEDEERLRLLRQTALELKGTLHSLLDFARPAGEEPPRGDLAAAAGAALRLVRHGIGKSLEVDERIGAEPRWVACPESLLVQAALHLVLAARTVGGPVAVEVGDGALRVSPAGPESLGIRAVGLIASAHGGALERAADGLTLRLPALRETRTDPSAD